MARDYDLTPYGSPGKFEGGSAIDQVAHDVTLDGAAEELGEADGFGWYGKIEGAIEATDEQIRNYDLSQDDIDYLAAVAGAIVSEDSNGFVSVEWYTSRGNLERAWRRLEREYEKWSEEAEGEGEDGEGYENPTRRTSYDVVVGNIGTVYSGTDRSLALQKYHEYVAQSKSGRGRAGGESVTLFRDGEIWKEHQGTVENPHLQRYGGREGEGDFRAMTLAEAKALHSGQHVWVLARQGDARRAKVNGAPRTWKRDPSRVEIPLKYGMYEYATFNEDDVAKGRLLVPQEGNPSLRHMGSQGTVSDYQSAQAYLERHGRRGSGSARLSANTELRETGQGIGVLLHSTYVVTYKPNGEIVLNSGGWHTSTTAARINQFLPAGYRVYRKNYGLRLKTPDGDVDFQDGMTIHT